MAESSRYACEVCPAAFMAPALEFAHAVRTRGSGCTRALCEVTVNVRRVPCVSSALARHVRGHTGELPHKCDVRPAGFTTFLWDNITHEVDTVVPFCIRLTLFRIFRSVPFAAAQFTAA